MAVSTNFRFFRTDSSGSIVSSSGGVGGAGGGFSLPSNLAYTNIQNTFSVEQNFNEEVRFLNSTGNTVYAKGEYPSSDPQLAFYHRTTGGGETQIIRFTETGVIVYGNLTVNGTEFIANTQTVLIKDNLLVINNGEVGAGVTAGVAGIQVDRGSLTDYQFLFDESSDTFRIGEIGSLQAVATREDSPTDGNIMTWDAATSSLVGIAQSGFDLDYVTTNGSTTTNSITVNGLTALFDPIDAQGDFRARSNIKFDSYAPTSGHNLLQVGTDGTVFTLPKSDIALQTDLANYYLASNPSGYISNISGFTTSDLTEGSNLYFTNSRARAALSFSAGSGAYNSSTGVITIPTNNNQITNGAGYITIASLANVAYTNVNNNFSVGQTINGTLTIGTSGSTQDGLVIKNIADNEWAIRITPNVGSSNTSGFFVKDSGNIDARLRDPSGTVNLLLSSDSTIDYRFNSGAGLAIGDTTANGHKLYVNGTASIGGLLAVTEANQAILLSGNRSYIDMDDGITRTFIRNDSTNGYAFYVNTGGEHRFNNYVRLRDNLQVDGNTTLVGAVTVNNNISALGNITGATFFGNGSGLTNINATNISSGTISDARLSSNVALKNINNNFSVGQTIGGNTTINGDLTIPEYIRHNGDNSYFGFQSNDNFWIGLAGSAYYTFSSTKFRSYTNVKFDGTLIVDGATTVNNNTTINGNLTVDTDTLFVDAANNRVGIGTTSALAKTHIKSGVSGFSGSLNGNYDDLAIEGGGNTGITILTPRANNGGIAFSDEDAEIQGSIVYRHSLDSMTFNTNAAERMRIDSSGNVGIGKSPASGFKLDVSGIIRSSSSITAVGSITSNSSISCSVDMYCQGTISTNNQTDKWELLDYNLDSGLTFNTGAYVMVNINGTDYALALASGATFPT